MNTRCTSITLTTLALIALAVTSISFGQPANESWNRISGNSIDYTVEYPAQGWQHQLGFQRAGEAEYVIVEEARLLSPQGALIDIDIWRDTATTDVLNWILQHESYLDVAASSGEATTATAAQVPAFRYEVPSPSGDSYPLRRIFFRQADLVVRLTYIIADSGVADTVFAHLAANFVFARTAVTRFEPNTPFTPLQRVPCGGHSDNECACGLPHHYPCCGNGGNCTWWASNRACCIWDDALPNWGNANSWYGAAQTAGYYVSSIPFVNTIACSNTLSSFGHVAFVLSVNGSTITVSEMGCDVSYSGDREHDYPISSFNQGFIYPRRPVPLSPPDNTSFTKGVAPIHLTWRPLGDAPNYEVWLDNNPGFGTPEIGYDNGIGDPPLSDGRTGETEFVLTVDMQNQLPQNFYWWKVKGMSMSWQILGGWSDSVRIILLDGVSVPPQVQNVSATDDGCDNVWVDWADVTNETGYHVYRDGVNISGNLAADATSYHDSPAVGTYSYLVRAFNSAGEGLASSTDQGQRRQAPPQVSNVSASDTRCGDIQITWTDVVNETNYRVYRNGTQIGTNLPANSTSYVDISATVGASYSYTVQACNGPTCCGTISAADFGIRQAGPAQVTGVSAGDDGCNGITVNWNNVANETGYRVYRDGNQVASPGVDATSCLDTPGAGSYSYTVQAYNACDNGPLSSAATGVQLATPAQVSGVAATVNSCLNVGVSWTDVGNEDGYVVYRDGVQVGTTNANGISYTDAPPAGTYSYTVAAHNSCGAGVTSAAANGRRLAVPAQVIGVTSTNDVCAGITVTWTDLGFEDGYSVYRNGTQVGQVQTNVTHYDDTPIPGIHSYTVTAFNGCGSGSSSEPVSGNRPEVPEQVASASATDASCDAVVISWTNVASETGYRVYRDGTSITTLGTDVLSYTDTPGPGSYSYAVCAFNTCGAGTLSGADNGTRLAVPSALTGVAATDDRSDSVIVTWNPAAGVDSVRILRDNQFIAYAGCGAARYADAAIAGHYNYCVLAYNACGDSPGVCDSGQVGTLNIEPAGALPTAFVLDQNYPNPFNPSTAVRFGLPWTEHVEIAVFDIIGHKVATLVSTTLAPGSYTTHWNCTNCSSGTYLIRMQAGDHVLLRKVLLMK